MTDRHPTFYASVHRQFFRDNQSQRAEEQRAQHQDHRHIKAGNAAAYTLGQAANNAPPARINRPDCLPSARQRCLSLSDVHHITRHQRQQTADPHVKSIGDLKTTRITPISSHQMKRNVS